MLGRPCKMCRQFSRGDDTLSIVIGHSSIEGWRTARNEDTARDAYLVYRFTNNVSRDEKGA